MNEFSGIATATLRTWLTDGQTAMQALALGKQTVAVGTAGRGWAGRGQAGLGQAGLGEAKQGFS